MRKILISPDYGAGWTTWSSGEIAKFMGSYQPIIEFLEAGGEFQEKHRAYAENNMKDPWNDFAEPGRKVLEQFCNECKERFGEFPYIGGADSLEVVFVGDEEVPIYEYDGYESIYPLHGGTSI